MKLFKRRLIRLRLLVALSQRLSITPASASAGRVAVMFPPTLRLQQAIRLRRGVSACRRVGNPASIDCMQVDTLFFPSSTVCTGSITVCTDTITSLFRRFIVCTGIITVCTDTIASLFHLFIVCTGIITVCTDTIVSLFRRFIVCTGSITIRTNTIASLSCSLILPQHLFKKRSQ